MVQLANHFVQHKLDKHGPDAWGIAFCDNLKALLSSDKHFVLLLELDLMNG
jgi:hypothetical protein